jgi:hypothetical protein
VTTVNASLGKTTLTFSPPAAPTGPATWVIQNDTSPVNPGSTGSYTCNLTAPSGWGFSSVTFQLQTKTGSSTPPTPSEWSTYVYGISAAPSTTVLREYHGVSITIDSFTTTGLVLQVTNNNNQPNKDITLGILLTVSNGSTSYTSPDPQLVLKPS